MAMVVAMTLTMVASTDVAHTIAMGVVAVTTVMMVAWEQTDSPPIALYMNTATMTVATMEEYRTTYGVAVEGVTSNKSMVKKISFSWTMLLA